MANVFILTVLTDPVYFFSWIVIVTFSICVHEYGHAITALKLGDDTAAEAGHLTLNPLVQMGWQSLVAMLLMGIAWGSVPIDPYVLGRRRWIVSIAGPVANLLLCLVFAFATVVCDILHGQEAVLQFLDAASVANAMLCIFNMLPIPMLDGWKVYEAVIPKMETIDPAQAQSLSWTLIIVVCVTPIMGAIWAASDAMAGSFIWLWARAIGLFV